MKHLFIVNPTAGGKDKSITVSRAVRAAFENQGGEYEVYITKAPMDAADKIRAEAAVHEHLRVYACGGDGTFNECVCGAALLDNVAVAPYPTGTGNETATAVTAPTSARSASTRGSGRRCINTPVCP